jgi:hypothetical protein
VLHAGPSPGCHHASYLLLLLMACSPADAVGPRAVLLPSSKVKELLWATLEDMVRAVEGFRVVGFNEVRGQCCSPDHMYKCGPGTALFVLARYMDLIRSDLALIWSV